ncbi:hypothetical protein P171DRAFT_85646 [Karstenula rhodostoma CBS 690.94]|uniref:Uncharacterized protein n=1 Tax=Karstenula rhodostoma CBS 690.94 TaxID=1392251 RepID=A0A9P4PBH7_9PLEO|nr:hypothetical protein P171DRAFT_85646 [Karstenula rhodostoma CBS 690.94]
MRCWMKWDGRFLDVQLGAPLRWGSTQWLERSLARYHARSFEKLAMPKHVRISLGQCSHSAISRPCTCGLHHEWRHIGQDVELAHIFGLPQR